jgi:hypothetical protein
VVFTLERMQIRDLGETEFNGYIDRRNLDFYYGGGHGIGKQKSVTKQKTKF